MHLTLLPVVEDILGEEFGTVAVEEDVVEDAKDEEGDLEEDVDKGLVDGCGVLRMLFGALGGLYP